MLPMSKYEVTPLVEELLITNEALKLELILLKEEKSKWLKSLDDSLSRALTLSNYLLSRTNQCLSLSEYTFSLELHIASLSAKNAELLSALNACTCDLNKLRSGVSTPPVLNENIRLHVEGLTKDLSSMRFDLERAEQNYKSVMAMVEDQKAR